MHLSDLVVVFYLRSHIASFPAPMIPIDFSVNKRLRIVPNSLEGWAEWSWWTLASAASTFVKEIIFLMLPSFPEAISADELVAGLIEVCQALENVRTKQSLSVINDGSWALMAFLRLEIYVERYQSGLWILFNNAERIYHTTNVK